MRKSWEKGLALSGRGLAAVCIGGVRFYQLTLSPLKQSLLGPGAGCRFQPTCSAYAIECFRKLPLGKALFYSVRRLLRCQPWGGSGYDPVPEKLRSDPGAACGGERRGSLKDVLKG